VAEKVYPGGGSAIRSEGEGVAEKTDGKRGTSPLESISLRGEGRKEKIITRGSGSVNN